MKYSYVATDGTSQVAGASPVRVTLSWFVPGERDVGTVNVSTSPLKVFGTFSDSDGKDVSKTKRDMSDAGEMRTLN